MDIICDLLSNNTPSISNIYNFVPIVIGSTKEIGAIINVIGISYCDLDLCLFLCYVNKVHIRMG